MFTLPIWGKVLIIGFALISGFVVKHFWVSYPDDNVIEEFIEDQIETQTGINVDVTPLSAE